jgi:hypothetical protein
MARTVRDILAEYEADLEKRLKGLRAQIIPLERELAEVKRARGAVSLVDYGFEQPQLSFAANSEAGTNASAERIGSNVAPAKSPYARLTIKKLVMKALEEQFERGATAHELLEFFANGYGRPDVVRTSLSPQLSRLKRDRKIILIDQKWSLPTAQNRESNQQSSPSNKAATSQ